MLAASDGEATSVFAKVGPSGSFLRRVVRIGPIAYSASIYGEWPVYTTHSDRHEQLANRLICNVLNTTYVYTAIRGGCQGTNPEAALEWNYFGFRIYRPKTPKSCTKYELVGPLDAVVGNS